MRAASPGFRTAGVLATSVDTASAGYDPARTKIFHDALLERLAAVGGIESASFVRVLPFSYRGYSTGRIAVDGYEAPPDEPPIVEYDEAGEGYLDTVGIPIVSGRGFTRSDDERSAPVAIVNEAMIARFWRGQDPVGRRLIVNGREMRVVGVAKMSKYQNLLEPPTPFFYVPLRQNGTGAGLVLRTTIGPQAMARVLAREIRAIDAGLAPGEVISMREQVDRMTASQSVAVTLLLIFGGLAVVLAAIGLYGVMSAAVSQARREFGLRLALGASPRDLVRLILTRGLVLSAAGLAAGAVAAAVLTRLLGSLLYHVGPRDPAAFVAAAALMGAASLLACAVPAWRATRTTPLVALRGD
jgi:predicted permease